MMRFLELLPQGGGKDALKVLAGVKVIALRIEAHAPTTFIPICVVVVALSLCKFDVSPHPGSHTFVHHP